MAKGVYPHYSGKESPHFGHRHSMEVREKIRRNTPIRTGKDNNRYKDGRSKTLYYKSFCESQRRARKKQNGGAHTFEEWEALKKTYKFKCLSCGKSEPEVMLGKDHIVPISLGGPDSIENLQPLCKSCNCKKYNKIINYKKSYESKTDQD